ncbi:MAG: HD domain-containing protein [Desulfobacterales bacterium]
MHKKESNTRGDFTKRSDGQSTDHGVAERALDRVKIFARRCFDKASGSHGWDHTLRVFRLCEKMGPAENADMAVLSAAAYLHDIGRTMQDVSNGAICHAEKGAQMAEPLVNSLPLSKERQHNILHCIRSHRFRNPNKPATIEAKVLFDADKLDAIGAVGVARAFLFAGELGARLHNPDLDAEKARPYSVDDTGYREYKVKLCKIKARMLTDVGRKWAQERHAFMEDFFNRFLAEYEGKR